MRRQIISWTNRENSLTGPEIIEMMFTRTHTHLIVYNPEELAPPDKWAKCLGPDPVEWVYKNKHKLLELDNQLDIIYGSPPSTDPSSLVRFLSRLDNVTIHSWPLYWFEQGWSDWIYRLVSPDIHNDFDYLVTSMMNRAHDHRCMVIDHLAKHDLLLKNPISWSGTGNGLYKWRWYDGSPIKLYGKDHQFDGHEIELYDRAFCDLVVESVTGDIFWTEKTVRPIMLGKPFFIIGAPGINTSLKDYGFQLYDELFDYSEDNNPNVEHRISCIVHQLKSLENQNLSDIYDSLQDKILYNYQQFKNIMAIQPTRPEISKMDHGLKLYPVKPLTLVPHPHVQDILTQRTTHD